MFDTVMFLLSALIFVLNKIVPLSKGKILYGNPKHFFEYLIEKKWGRPIWITNITSVFNYVCQEYSKEYVVLRKGIIGNIKYIFHYLTSSAIIIRGRNDSWDILKYTKTKRRAKRR